MLTEIWNAGKHSSLPAVPRTNPLRRFPVIRNFLDLPQVFELTSTSDIFHRRRCGGAKFRRWPGGPSANRPGTHHSGLTSFEPVASEPVTRLTL
jgi:hypothetical protein